jgi:hypothetical protein
VLGRYSNQGVIGAGVRTLRDRASTEVREQPWEPPKLVGTTRVRRLLAIELGRMIADYERGMGCVWLSRRYGVAENTVLTRLRAAGVTVRSQRLLDAASLEEMAALRADGWTLRALGEKYGVTRQTVAARLRGGSDDD